MKYTIALTCVLSAFFMNAEQKPAVLITGGAGYIGSHIGCVLAKQGYDVVVIDHNIKRTHPWAHYVQADYADPKALGEIFNSYPIECVFHCAAFAIIPESFGHAAEFYENNIEKTIQLLRIMRTHNVNRIIFASSRAIYGDAHYIPIDENHPKNPLSPYARTKLFTEYILEDLHRQYGLEYVALRFVNAVGAMPEDGLGEAHDPETHVFPLVMRAARNGTVFKIYGTDHATYDGTCVRTYIHVQDIAQANYQAFEYLKKGGKSDVFQLGSEAVLSIKEMVAAVEQFYGKKINVVILPKREGDSPELISNYSKAQRVLGWTPRYSSVANIIASMDAFDAQNKNH